MITTKTRNMENQSRIEELLSDALRRYDQMLEKHDRMVERFDQVLETQNRLIAGQADLIAGQTETNLRLARFEKRSDRMENELVKLNLQANESTRAIIKLADKLPIIFEHEKRIVKLETTVYK